jgi:hypothetical protein
MNDRSIKGRLWEPAERGREKGQNEEGDEND